MNTKMKKSLITCALFFFVTVAISFAFDTTDMSKVMLRDVQGRDWYLTEVKKESATITIDRTKGPKDIYTIRFEVNRLSGVGAPNRFFAPYFVGEESDLTIGVIGSTRMGTVFEMEGFREYEYFKCLKNVNHWYMQNGNLVLYTYPEDDTLVILTFM